MTLVSVLIVSAVAVSTAVSLVLLGSEAAAVSNLYGSMAQSRSLGDSCAEVALENIALDPSYTTDEVVIDFPDDNSTWWCSYIVESKTGENAEEQRIIKTTGVAQEVYARNHITVTVGPIETYPVPIVVSWQHVATF